MLSGGGIKDHWTRAIDGNVTHQITNQKQNKKTKTEKQFKQKTACRMHREPYALPVLWHYDCVM